MATDIKYKKSAMQELVEALPGMFQQYQQNIIGMEQAELDRQHDADMKKLDHTFRMLESESLREKELEDKAMDLGLTITNVESDTGKEIGMNSLDSLNNELKSTSKNIINLTSQITTHSQGKNFAKIMDNNADGRITQPEIDTWVSTFDNEEEALALLSDENFQAGMRTFAYDPAQIAALEEKTTATDILKTELSFLPAKYQQDYELGKLTLDAKGLTNKQLVLELEKINQSIQSGKQNITLQALQIENFRKTIEREEYKFGQEQYSELITNFQNFEVDNLAAQNEIGAGLAGSISLNLTGNEWVPLISMITAGEQDLVNVKNYLSDMKDSDKTGFIFPELRALYQASLVGRADPTVGNYSFFLQQLPQIKEYRTNFQDWFNSEGVKDGLISRKGSTNPKDYLDFDNVKWYAHENLSNAEYNEVMRYLSWNNTGIYDDMDLINSGIKSIDQIKEVRNDKETIMNYRIGAGFKGTSEAMSVLDIIPQVQSRIPDGDTPVNAPYIQKIDEIFNTAK